MILCINMSFSIAGSWITIIERQPILHEVWEWCEGENEWLDESDDIRRWLDGEDRMVVTMTCVLDGSCTRAYLWSLTLMESSWLVELLSSCHISYLWSPLDYQHMRQSNFLLYSPTLLPFPPYELVWFRWLQSSNHSSCWLATSWYWSLKCSLILLVSAFDS